MASCIVVSWLYSKIAGTLLNNVFHWFNMKITYGYYNFKRYKNCMSSMIKNKNIFKGFFKKNLPQTPVFFLDMITVKFHMDPSISFLRHASMFKFIYV